MASSGPPGSGLTRAAVSTFKFASVASLGLLTGTTLSQALLTPPALLSLPHPQSAAPALSSLKHSFLHIHRTLARSTIALSLAAFFLSPRGWRHPYLLWLCLASSVTARYVAPEVHFFVLPESKYFAFLRVDSGTKGHKGKGKASRQRSPEGSEKEWEEMRMSEATRAGETGEEVNGEAVRARIEGWGWAMKKLATGYGLAFAMGIMGLWGDGFRA